MLKEEYRYFSNNRARLAQSYPDQYLAIKDGRVLFAVKSLSEAIDRAAHDGLKEGEYLLQYCDHKGEGFVAHYRSRARFGKQCSA